MGYTLRIAWIIAAANLMLGGYIGFRISDNPSIYLPMALLLGVLTLFGIPNAKTRLLAGIKPLQQKIVIAIFIYGPTVTALALAVGSYEWYQPLLPLFASALFFSLILNEKPRRRELEDEGQEEEEN